MNKFFTLPASSDSAVILVQRTISSALLLAVNITLILAYDSQKCLLIKLSKKTLFKILSD